VHHMQVMKLGVLKVVADKIPALLFELCGQGDARRGPKDETLVAVNERIAHMGRLILATLAPPGYVDCCAYGVCFIFATKYFSVSLSVHGTLLL